MRPQLEKGQMPAKGQPGAELSPSLPASRRQAQPLLAPGSSGALARLLPRRRYPTRPRLSSAPGNLGWKENKPLGSATAACGKPEPAAAASMSGGGSTRLERAQHGHRCPASCELPSPPLSSAASGALRRDTRLLPGSREHHVLVCVPVPAQTLQLHQEATAGPCSPPALALACSRQPPSGQLAGAGAGSGWDLALPVGAACTVPDPVSVAQTSAAWAHLVDGCYTRSAAPGSQRGSLLPPHPHHSPSLAGPLRCSPGLPNIFMGVSDPHSRSLGGCLCMTSPSPSRKSGTGLCRAMTHS